jgi:hypothetical protein
VPTLCPNCKVRLVDSPQDYRRTVLPPYVEKRVTKAVGRYRHCLYPWRRM